MPSAKVKTRILIVDDEPRVIHLVRAVLSAAGYKVLTAFSGEQAVETVALEQPNLVLLDIILSGELDGYQVVQRLREFSDVPIIMLTAMARETDLLRGFDVGADDYITKPFSAKELLARVQAVLKRCKEEASSTQAKIVCGDLCIDLARRQVTIGNREVRLTPTEYNLLHELAIHNNQILFHEQLLTAVWGSEYRNDLDYLRAYIHHLREKIERDPSNPKIIVRCPGVGYMLVCPTEAPDKQKKMDDRLLVS